MQALRADNPGSLDLTSVLKVGHSPKNPKFTTDQLRSHLADSSRALADLTAGMVYDEPELFDVLVELALTGEKQYSNRASRIISICGERFPEMVQPHTRRLIRELGQLKDEGVIRNLMKIFSEVPLKLSRHDQSILVNLCFDYLTSGRYPVAIRVYGMQVLHNLSREFPEIGQELARILEDQMPDETPGYRSRAKKILGRMGKL